MTKWEFVGPCYVRIGSLELKFDNEEQARKAAAVPELLDTLDKIQVAAIAVASLPTCGEVGTLSGIANLARAAIAKATGEKA